MNPKLYCFACMSRLETEDARCPVCGHDNRVRVNGKGLLPFSIIKNRYLIGKALGRGGFGVTYMGLDLSLERRVAIKEYYPADLVSRETGQSELTPYDEDTRARFERGRERSKLEARTIASLNDVPDTVNVHDVFLANDTLYIVMEFIQGETLRARVKAMGGKIPAETLYAMLRPILTALTQVHRQGVIHRDVSPDNIMFRATNGRPVLLDFGAAHNMQADAESEHSTSLRPGYAPVEQYSRTGLQDARTDEYALCATMYFALTGVKPVAAMERAFGDETLLPPSALGVSVPPAFEQALMKGLSVQAKDRYPDIAGLEAALEAGLGGAAHDETPATARRDQNAAALPEATVRQSSAASPTVPSGQGASAFPSESSTDLAPATVSASASGSAPLAPSTSQNVPGAGEKPLLLGLSKRSWLKLLLLALVCAVLVALVGLLKPATPPALPATAEPTATAFLTAVFLPTDPPPSEEPSPTQAVEPYVGYAVTTRETELRSDVTLDDSSVIRTLPADTVLYLNGYTVVDMITWSGAQTVMGELSIGIVRGDAVRHIGDAEAQRLISGYQTPLPTPEPTLTPAPTPMPTATPVATPTAVPTTVTPKPTRKASTTIAGTVTHYPRYGFDGDTIYSNPDGWQYLNAGEYAILWGLEESNTADVSETLTIPLRIDGRLNYLIAPDFADRAAIDRDKVRSIVVPEGVEWIEPRSFAAFTRLETLDLPAGIGLANDVLDAACDRLSHVTIGAGVRFLDQGALPAPFSKVLFHGTLVLADGATIPSLENFFAPGSDYTLSCLPDAVPAGSIPAGVKVMFRDATTVKGTAAPTPTVDPDLPVIIDPDAPVAVDPVTAEPPGIVDPDHIGATDAPAIGAAGSIGPENPGGDTSSKATVPLVETTSQKKKVGTVKGYDYYSINGEPIYRTQEGWLFLKLDDGPYLWGITKTNSLGDLSTLTLPARIDGEDVKEVGFLFSHKCEIDISVVKHLLIPDTYTSIYGWALDGLTGLETLVGGRNLTELSFYLIPHQSPFYQNNFDRNLVIGQGMLVNGLPDANRTVTVPEGVRTICDRAFLGDREFNLTSPVTFTSITLPDSLTSLNQNALVGFGGKEIRIPNGVTLGDYPICADGFSYYNNPTVRRIVLGRGVTWTNQTHLLGLFTGELYLEGDSYPSLDGLFGNGVTGYTLNCLPGAVPADSIPKGVTVVYH